MKHSAIALLLICLGFSSLGSPFSVTYHVTPRDIQNGYIVKRISLTQYATPQVQLENLQYKANAGIPANAVPSDPHRFNIVLGKERKQPFALVYIPVYAQEGGTTRQLTDVTLNITEPMATMGTRHAMSRTTAVSTSVLNAGTWYKIAIPATGFYKIDGNLLAQMGLSNVASADIRLFGNGGNMLSENNAVPRPPDLLENAILMQDGGDGTFHSGDYFVFYGMGPTAWQKDSINQRFNHQNNLYSDTAYYFLTVNQGTGLRIGGQGSTPSGNITVTSFDDYAVHDVDLVNPAQFGKQWYGEEISQRPGKSTSMSLNFQFGTQPESIRASAVFGSISNVGNNIFTTTINGQPLGTYLFPSPNITSNTTDPIASNFPTRWTSNVNSTNLTIDINYQSSSSTAQGFLDYIELNVRRPLTITGAQLSFRDWRSVGAGNVATYRLEGANGSTQVWDVTNPQVPVQMNGSLNGSTYSFSQNADMLHEFAAMNSADFPIPSYIGTVANQNLHGIANVDDIIITHPSLLAAANELADFHRQNSNLRVAVVTIQQVYNEFSSGAQDISALRDFIRMVYDNAGNDTVQMPRYLTLLGSASYDYKNRVANNINLVPTFESTESHDNVNSLCSDDFFSFLDDNESIENNSVANTMDIGVGRLPARTLADAQAMVNKIKVYKSTASLGPWRLSNIFAADREDAAGPHMEDGEIMSADVTEHSKDLYNQTKVYLDAIPVISTPAGDRCPNANASINDRIFKGTFLINYNGHGSPEVWSTKRILTKDDFFKWSNLNTLPIMITATCDFGRFDQPQYVSAAEQLVVKSNGGVIVALTTTQAVYQSSNRIINRQFLQQQFNPQPNGDWLRFGDAYRYAKNMTYAGTPNIGDVINFRKFALLGDPALLPDFPEHSIATDSVIDAATQQRSDSIKALGAYVVYGSVTDAYKNVLTDFNGLVSVTFYDKPRSINTITAINKTFKLQDNIIYRGKATVTNGHFSYTFIAPKDINYSYGGSKISSYATNNITDAAGADTSVIVGGFSDNPVISTTPPVVKAYINDTFFTDGGITGSNTKLYVTLQSETGINVSGSSVGHDLIGILDGEASQPYVLNEFYETLPNTYKQGIVSYPITGLSDGKHSITVRAWDMNDNYDEGTVNFVVYNGEVVQLDKVMNYPNPFKDVTHFVFEHNHPEEQLHVEIQIYNTAGAHVRTIKQDFTPTGSRSSEITWDGTGDNGGKLATGMYVYRINVATSQGSHSTGYQKLVLVR